MARYRQLLSYKILFRAQHSLKSDQEMKNSSFISQQGNKRIAVAMSGGVDSSVAAALMVERGYQVIGLTLQLYDHGTVTGNQRTCCAGRDIYDARRVAARLNIPHYVLDYEDRFKQAVIEDFADSYIRGSTPIPCVRCNERIKFQDLLGTARSLNADALVTGHYARRIATRGSRELHKASNLSRDQSYFLFTITPEQLDYLRFPLGGLEKDQTRDLAKSFDLPVAAKPDSQDICFVPDGDYARTIEKLRPEAAEPGDIVLDDETIIGQHAGIIHFTVGQRRGLGIAWPEPLYVLRLIPDTREVVVGPKSSLQVTRITLNNVNWLTPAMTVSKEVKLTVKIRSAHRGTPARVRALPNGRAEIDFDHTPGAVSPGQAAVFYDSSRLIGGGWIE